MTKTQVVRVPVVVQQDGGWVEVRGVRYAAPAVVPVRNSGTPERLLVGSAAHSPRVIKLSPEFQWKSMWLGPMGVIADMATGAAWQQSGDLLQVDLARSTSRRASPPFVETASYRDATRLRSYGKRLVLAGALGAAAGNLLMFSAVCYEECDAGMGRRMSAAMVVQGVAVAALVGGAIAWYKGAKRRDRIRRSFLERPTW